MVANETGRESAQRTGADRSHIHNSGIGRSAKSWQAVLDHVGIPNDICFKHTAPVLQRGLLKWAEVKLSSVVHLLTRTHMHSRRHIDTRKDTHTHRHGNKHSKVQGEHQYMFEMKAIKPDSKSKSGCKAHTYHNVGGTKLCLALRNCGSNVALILHVCRHSKCTLLCHGTE